jgi:leucyl-tRNA synthetase
MGIETGAEPMLQLRNQGQILAGDGARMSKSRGNTTDPDELVARHGGDAVRAFLMFGYRWSEGGPWNDGNIHGVVRWLGRVWDLAMRIRDADVRSGLGYHEGGDAKLLGDVIRSMHQTIQRVSHRFEEFEFNTVVSELMKLTNAILAAESSAESTFIDHPRVREAVLTLLTLMAPVTPHLAEELWERLGQPYSIHRQRWPEADVALAADELVTLVVQVNGKVRGKVEVPAGIEQPEAEALARAVPNVARALGERPPRRVIAVAGKLINFVL